MTISEVQLIRCPLCGVDWPYVSIQGVYVEYHKHCFACDKAEIMEEVGRREDVSQYRVENCAACRGLAPMVPCTACTNLGYRVVPLSGVGND